MTWNAKFPVHQSVELLWSLDKPISGVRHQFIEHLNFLFFVCHRILHGCVNNQLRLLQRNSPMTHASWQRRTRDEVKSTTIALPIFVLMGVRALFPIRVLRSEFANAVTLLTVIASLLELAD